LKEFDWNWSAAGKELRRALALNPNLGRAHLLYGDLLLATRDFPAAEAEYRRAKAIDPLNSGLARTMARLDYFSGRTKDRAAAGPPACTTLDCLEGGFARRDPEVQWLLADPAYEGMRGDPRFQKLVRGIKQP
jgi:tetratricopeptide (TPR) repeat protein